MKNMTITAKILMTCAIVFVLGLVMTIGGCAAGGLEGFRSTAAGSDPENIDIIEGDYEFSSIEANGCADFEILGNRYYNDIYDDTALVGHDIEAKAGKVIVIYDKRNDAPKVSAEGGRLMIDVPEKDGINFDFDDNFTATVIVLCGDDELEEIKIDSPACDSDIKGVTFKTADIQANAGDVEMHEVTSGGILIKANAGDVELSGKLKGTTEVKCNEGDIEVDTFDDPSTYSMELKASAGEIKVGKDEIEGGKYEQTGGSDMLRLKANAGEIEVGRM